MGSATQKGHFYQQFLRPQAGDAGTECSFPDVQMDLGP